jgi:hypothetical protein
MTEIATPRGSIWFDRDLPVLLATAELLDETIYGNAQTHAIAERSGIPQPEVVKALNNLKSRYVLVKDASSVALRDYMVIGLTPAGLEAAGVWPSGETLTERMVGALQAVIDEAPEGSPKSNKLKAVLASIKDAGIEIVGSVVGQAINRGVGIG